MRRQRRTLGHQPIPCPFSSLFLVSLSPLLSIPLYFLSLPLSISDTHTSVQGVVLGQPLPQEDSEGEEEEEEEGGRGEVEGTKTAGISRHLKPKTFTLT